MHATNSHKARLVVDFIFTLSLSHSKALHKSLKSSLLEDGALDLLPAALFVLLASALGTHFILSRADLAH